MASINDVLGSNGLTKRGPGARKIGGALEFQKKVISKKKLSL